MNELEQNYLAHHGILGQRWHKRNGPPYPLDAGDHSKSEKEAGYKKSLGGGRNEDMYDRKARKKEAKRLTKQLNKMDKEIAYNIRDYNDANKALNKFSNKAAKKKSKGKELSDRDNEKIEKQAEKLGNAMLNIDEGRRETEKILNELPDGFDLRQYYVPRDVTKFTERLLYGAAGVYHQRNVLGVEYQVKDNKKKVINDKENLERLKNINASTQDIENWRSIENRNNSKYDPETEWDQIQAKLADSSEGIRVNRNDMNKMYRIAEKKEKEYLKSHPDAVDLKDYDFVDDFLEPATEEVMRKYKR